jgi:hypothetical protein
MFAEDYGVSYENGPYRKSFTSVNPHDINLREGTSIDIKYQGETIFRLSFRFEAAPVTWVCIEAPWQNYKGFYKFRQIGWTFKTIYDNLDNIFCKWFESTPIARIGWSGECGRTDCNNIIKAHGEALMKVITEMPNE